MRTSWEQNLILWLQYLLLIVLFCFPRIWWECVGLNTNSTITFADDSTVAKSKPAKKRCKILLSGVMRTIWLFLRKQKELIVGFGRHRATENTSIYLWGVNWRGSAVLGSLASLHRGPLMDPQHLLPGKKKHISSKCLYLPSQLLENVFRHSREKLD